MSRSSSLPCDSPIVSSSNNSASCSDFFVVTITDPVGDEDRPGVAGLFDCNCDARCEYGLCGISAM